MLRFESYSHNNEEVSLHWMEEPITIMGEMQMPDFDVSSARAGERFGSGM